MAVDDAEMTYEAPTVVDLGTIVQITLGVPGGMGMSDNPTNDGMGKT